MGVRRSADIRALLFDRDGTLVVDVPYNSDPRRVRLMPTAAHAVRILRDRGIRVGVVTNQSGIGRGLLSEAQVRAVNDRIDQLLGGLDTWQVCPHVPDDCCECRKPAPGLIAAAAAHLDVDPTEVAVVGDVAADINAAAAAGVVGIMVPTSATMPEEVDAARYVAPTTLAAVRQVVEGAVA